MPDRLKCSCCGVAGATPSLVMAFADLEAKAGPQRVTSGYRCERHQAALRRTWVNAKAAWALKHPGEKYPVPEPALHSQHSRGNAIDVLCPKAEQPALIAAARSCGFTGVGIAETFLHFDIRPAPAEWTY